MISIDVNRVGVRWVNENVNKFKSFNLRTLRLSFKASKYTEPAFYESHVVVI